MITKEKLFTIYTIAVIVTVTYMSLIDNLVAKLYSISAIYATITGLYYILMSEEKEEKND